MTFAPKSAKVLSVKMCIRDRNYGYNRYNPGVMFVAVVLIVVLVQLFQTVGTRISVSLDHRITDRGGKKRRSK